MLLNKRPTKLDEAIKVASDVEFAFDFGMDGKDHSEELAQVFSLQKQQQADREAIQKLQSAVETLTDRLEKCTLGQPTRQSQVNGQGRGRGRRPVDMTRVQCFKCHEYGHYQYQCPLNERQPVPRKGGDWLQSQ